MTRSIARGAGLLGAIAAAVAGTMLAAGPAPAAAATVDGTATVTQPGLTSVLSGGGSATQFSVGLPAQAACSGDTAHGGYHVYSYLLKKGVALSGVTFVNTPSAGYGLVDTLGSYYGAVNTAVTTGQIVGIPNDFAWAPLVTHGYAPASTLLYSGSGSSAKGVWEAGLACADTNGKPVDNWNTEVTFSASSSDANGFTWTDVPGLPTTTTTTTTTSTTTTTVATTATTTPTGNGSGTPSSTTSTTAAVGTTAATGDGSTGTGTGDAASTGTPASATSDPSNPTLAFTGIDLARDIGVGVLCLGVACLLLGWGYRSRTRRLRDEGSLAP